MDRRGMENLLSDGGTDGGGGSNSKSRVRLFNMKNVLNSRQDATSLADNMMQASEPKFNITLPNHNQHRDSLSQNHRGRKSKIVRHHPVIKPNRRLMQAVQAIPVNKRQSLINDFNRGSTFVNTVNNTSTLRPTIQDSIEGPSRHEQTIKDNDTR